MPGVAPQDPYLPYATTAEERWTYRSLSAPADETSSSSRLRAFHMEPIAASCHRYSWLSVPGARRDHDPLPADACQMPPLGRRVFHVDHGYPPNSEWAHAPRGTEWHAAGGAAEQRASHVQGTARGTAPTLDRRSSPSVSPPEASSTCNAAQARDSVDGRTVLYRSVQTSSRAIPVKSLEVV